MHLCVQDAVDLVIQAANYIGRCACRRVKTEHQIHLTTLRILELMHWQHRLRLTVSHFLSLPGIVRGSDLAVLMPRNFAQGFAEAGAVALIEPDLPLRDFTVSMHWSQRFDKDPCLQWLRGTVSRLFSTTHNPTPSITEVKP